MKSALAFVLASTLAGAAFAQSPAAPAAAGTPSPTPQADATFDAMDRNRDGNLTREEFRAGWVALNRAAAVRQRLRGQFDSVDTNKDGGIDANEYRNLVLVRDLGANAPAFGGFDADRDGKLGFDEYLELVQRLAPRDGGNAAPRNNR